MSIAMDAQHTFLNAIALRPLNWQLCRVVDYAVWCCTSIEVEIRWPSNRFSSAKGVIYIQNTPMLDSHKAMEFLQYICSNARVITKLSVTVEVSDTTMANAVFETVHQGKQVHLEEIRVRRRYVGQQFPKLIELIKTQSHTLKVIGKLGLGEAIQAFDENTHLDRFSMINFDLIENGEMESNQLTEKTRFAMRSGFEITKNPAQHMLKMCQVKSIRLTQQKGVAISDPPVVRALLPELKNIELVGCLEVKVKDLEALFPALESFNLQKQDLVTGN
uniref:Uncharacterized protein n=1 Tax=Ditylenchus dipsaci TaxID=166011 RepID=A0A915DNT2_9BILA